MTSKKALEDKPDKLTRKGFFNKIWAGLGMLAGFNLIILVGGFLAQCRRLTKKIELNNFVEVGNVDEIKPNSVISMRKSRFYLSRLADGGFIAVSTRCSHLACVVEWEADKNKFFCPCHSSAFNINGNVINPPAPRALDYYPVIIKNGVVIVNIAKKIKRSRFIKTQATYVKN